MHTHNGAIILECTNTFDAVRQRSGIIRPLAPFALNELFVKRNIPSTVINYVNAWDAVELVEVLKIWTAKHNVTQPLVLCSTLFSENLLSEKSHVANIVLELKKVFPDLKLILGGPIIVLIHCFLMLYFRVAVYIFLIVG